MTKKTFYNFLISSACYILLGIALIVWPLASMNLFCYIVGAVTAAYGLWRIYRFIFHREEKYVTVGLFVGIIALALGICFFVKPAVFSSILPIVLGLYLIFDGVVKLRTVFDIKKEGYPKWLILLLLALLMIVLGLVTVFNPFQTASVLVVFIGVSMIVDGAINIWNAIVVRQHLKHLKEAVQNAAEAAAEAAGAAAEAAGPEIVAETEAVSVETPEPAPAPETPEKPAE